MYTWNLILFPFWPFVLRHEGTRVSSRWRRRTENKWRSPLKSYLAKGLLLLRRSMAVKSEFNRYKARTNRHYRVDISIDSKNTDLSNIDVLEKAIYLN